MRRVSALASYTFVKTEFMAFSMEFKATNAVFNALKIKLS